MPILYRDTATPAPPTPPLDGRVRADVAVVGGGITGCPRRCMPPRPAPGWCCSRREDPGFGASGRNGGQVNPGLKPDPDTVERDFGADLGGRMNALAGAAPSLVFDLIQRHSIACDARRNGTLRAAVRPRARRRDPQHRRAIARRGAPVEYLERERHLARHGNRPLHAAPCSIGAAGISIRLSYARGLARAAIGAGRGDARRDAACAACGARRAAGGSRPRAAASSHRTWCSPPTATPTVCGRACGARSCRLFGAIAASRPLAEAVSRAFMPSRAGSLRERRDHRVLPHRCAVSVC